MRIRSLTTHADYLCRHDGVCCTSGWEIPVEPAAEGRLRRALRSGRLLPLATSPRAALVERAELPHGARVVLGHVDSRCAFFDAGSRLCAAQRDVGEDALPGACRQFPRVVTLTPLGVSLTLSHHCPAAAALLFEDLPLAIRESPPAFPAGRPYEGLDAREALPPFLRPGVLMTWAALERWEEYAVAVLAADASPAAALRTLALRAETARAWTPEDGDFDSFFARVLLARSGAAGAQASGLDAAAALASWDDVAASVPPRRAPRRPAAALEPEAGRLVEAGWSGLALPLRRWLASKAFASWVALQGDGLRTTVAGLGVALGVAWAEAARGCAQAGRALDAALLQEAIRRADLLLLHLADPQRLAVVLGACERQPASRVLRSQRPPP